jgi:hypothetical protein
MLFWQITVMVSMAVVTLIAIWGTAKNRREDADKE